MGCSFSGLNALSGTVGGGSDVWVKDYRFRVLRRLGDAGPAGSSFFLIKEVIAAADTAGAGPGAAGLAKKKGVDPSHISGLSLSLSDLRVVRYDQAQMDS
jgi:serine/threonine kinase 16